MSRWSQPGRVAAIIVIGGLLLLAGATSFARRAGADLPELGVTWTASSTGPVATALTPRGPASRAGLAHGDVLVEVEGQPVVDVLAAAEAAWADPGADGTIALVVRRGDGIVRLEAVPEAADRTDPYGYLALVALAFWASGMLVAIRWPRVRGGRHYAALAACMSANLALSHTGVGDGLDWAIWWLDVAAGALWPALLLHLGIVLTRRTLRPRRLALGAAYGTAALLGLGALALSPATGGWAYRFPDPLLALETRDRLETLFVAVAAVVTAVLLVKSHALSPSARHRSQTRWLLGGLTLGLGPFVVLHAVPWAVGAPELPGWGRFVSVLPLLILPATFTVALARYRLSDLDLLLLRAMSEVTALFITLATAATTVFLLREAVSAWTAPRGWTRWVGFLVALIAYPKLRSWSRAAVDRAFYRQRYSYRATLLDWARELNADTDLGVLLGHLRDRVRATLGVAEARVLVRTAPWRFEALDRDTAAGVLELDEASLEALERETCQTLEAGAAADLPWARYLFPMRVKGRLRAVLAVAERDAEDKTLGGEDRALLGTLAAHAATAIEAARLFREVRQRADEIERLHAQQERILESSAIGLLLLDAEGRVLAWNRALEDIAGVGRDEAVGRPVGDVLPLQVARRIERELGGAVPGDSRIFRLNLVNVDGERRVVNIAISPAGDPSVDGGAVVTFDDVTERVGLEAQMLQQERLASLGLLAAGVAHEINTPLTGISSYAQMLREEDPGDPGATRQVLRKIEEQTRRASDIANSLLTLARPERQGFEELDLNATVRQALQLFQPQVRGRRIRLEPKLDEARPHVRGHRGKLQQVLLNLLLNARDAVADGGRISVETRDEGDRVVLEVCDDGAGIRAEDLPHIFDPFYTTKGRGRGSGLGLSITYGIIEQHGGTIHAESDDAGGSRFRVELPSARATRAMA